MYYVQSSTIKCQWWQYLPLYVPILAAFGHAISADLRVELAISHQGFLQTRLPQGFRKTTLNPYFRNPLLSQNTCNDRQCVVLTTVY